MIDLRYAWHQQDVTEHDDTLGRSAPLPSVEGFKERIFNIGTEW